MTDPTDRPAADPPLPAQLGKYRITGVLGRGAMGVVYKAEDPVIRRVVAVKTIRQRSAMMADPQAMAAARFRNEAQAAGRLSHPGIVAVYDYGEQGDEAWIAMEYVEGQTLAHYLQQKIVLTDADILSVMVQLLEALEHAHDNGVWHRDIKPSNLIVTPRGRVKVNDFGVARIENSDLTQMSVLIGTPHFMAPEQYLDGPIDRRVDLWASGVLLYQLLTGRLPFQGTPEAVMYQVMHHEPQPPSVLAPQRPAFYDAIVQRALAKPVEARYASAAMFLRDLLEASNAPALPTVSEETVVMAASAVRRPGAALPEGYGSLHSGGGGGGSGGGGSSGGGGGQSGGPVSAFGAEAQARGTPGSGALPRPLSGSAAQPAGFASGFSGGHPSGSSSGSGPGAGGGQNAGLGPVAAASPGTVPPGWDVARLEPIEAELARLIGPVAKVLVRRAARECSDEHGLRIRLSAHLGDEAERTRFIVAPAGPGGGLEPVFGAPTGASHPGSHTRSHTGSATGSTPGSSPPGTGPGGAAVPAPPPPQPPSAALLAEVTRRLTPSLGPIAQVLVRRAAKDCDSVDTLLLRLGVHLADEGERERLRRSLGGMG